MDRKSLPRGWREDEDGQVACPHRDVSVCPGCADADFIVEVYGQFFFAPDGLPFGFDRPECLTEPFCACGHVISRCNNSRRGCA